MSRITLNDDIVSAMVKLAEGNPGALTVMTRTLKEAAAIDPQCAFGPLGAILSFDTHRVYGPRIWMLYKDVCGENLVKMLAVLRAVQLGIIPSADMEYAIDNYGKGLNVDDLLEKVKGQLKEFDRISEEKEENLLTPEDTVV